ncbi:alpha/beta hydrolase [Variovorax sp. J22R24]|uniref:alpha/beta fold hydrolase n=1 Tax=Variovorax gracilis TaxID=3053502 RepID=UPI002576D1BE|nr:alpha/beta hydrolase [Variovorax sp. J22R24]MDM0109864.1 alpha/beta hydrolase [Variovorax sp. J22R24]
MTDAELRSAEVNGLSVSYRQAGQGAALVFLHGFLCDSRCWTPQLSGLSDSFRVVAWDAPGAGASSDPPDTFKMIDYAHCLARFLDTVGIDRAHVVGLSWGGILAQEFYRLYPERLRCLVLADTYAGWKGSLPEPAWKERLADCLLAAAGPPEALVAQFVPSMFSELASEDLRAKLSSILSEFHPAGFRLMASSCAEMDTRKILPSIDVPTLLLWGDDDRRSPIQVAEQFHTAIPGAELVIVSSAGHVSNMERPDAFNLHLRRFCMEHNAA